MNTTKVQHEFDYALDQIVDLSPAINRKMTATKRKQWVLKTNKIYNQCCLKTMAKLPDACIDLVVTSPPYDNMREYSGNTFNQFEQIAGELYRVLAIGGVLVWVVGDETKDGDESGTSFRQALYFKEIGFKLFDTMIYSKPPRGAVGNNKTYWQSFEFMFILAKEHPKTINLICDRKNKDAREGDSSRKRYADGSLMAVKRQGYKETGRRTNVWQYLIGKGHSTKDAIAFEHPAIFPEKLAHDHILSWSNPGDLVYDPFMGSGTTAKMAQVLNRRWLGSEISREYCRVATKRLKNAVC